MKYSGSGVVHVPHGRRVLSLAFLFSARGVPAAELNRYCRRAIVPARMFARGEFFFEDFVKEFREQPANTRSRLLLVAAFQTHSCTPMQQNAHELYFNWTSVQHSRQKALSPDPARKTRPLSG